MDETLERLRRALKTDPADRAARLELASALERLGRFDEAWDLLALKSDDEDVRPALAQLADKHPRGVLERVQRADYPSARRLIDVLVACGRPRHPALVALATNPEADGALRRLCRRALAGTFEGDVSQALADYRPEMLYDVIEDPEGRVAPERVGRRAAAEAEAWRGRMRAAIGLQGASTAASAAAALPWLIPFLASRDEKLAARALAVVQQLTTRDEPPFDVETIAAALERRQ